MVNQIVDLLIIAILIIGSVIGAKKGFIKSVLKMGAGIISVIISYAFTSKLADFFNRKYIFTPVKEKIGAAVNQYITDINGGEISAEGLVNAIPESLRNILSLVGYNVDEVANNAFEAGNNTLEKFISSSSELVANILSTIFAFVILFLGTFVVLKILSVVLDAVIKKIPGVSQINSALGFLFGFLCTIINIWIFSGLAISVLEAIRVSSPDFLNGFSAENTVILKLFTSINPILLFFK